MSESQAEPTPNPTPASTAPKVTPIRWKSLVVLLTLACITLAFVWGRDADNRQKQVILTLLILTGTWGLSLLWALILSGLKGLRRLQALGVLFLLPLAGLALFRLDGFSGDFVPLFSPRWVQAPEAPADLAEVQDVGGNLPEPVDFAQMLGPDRNGILPERVAGTNWVLNPPRELWRREVGPSWSGFSVVADRAITQEQYGDQEKVICYALQSGDLLWQHADTAKYTTPIGGEGPRANPTIFQEKVYTQGAMGHLNCLDLQDGSVVWSHDLITEYGGKVPEWGFSGSPLIHEGRVLAALGKNPKDMELGDNKEDQSPRAPDGALAAFDAQTGELLWTAEGDSLSYASLMVHTLDGVPQILHFGFSSIAGHDLQNGKQLWSHPWRANHPHCANPVPIGEDTLLVSSGYGFGSRLLQVSRDEKGDWKVQEKWRTTRFKAKFSNYWMLEGTVYGLDDGMLAALDPNTGDRLWKEGRYGHGQVLALGREGIALSTTESGQVKLLQLSPQAPLELGTLTAFDHKMWNPPTVAGRFLLVRTHREAACFVLPPME